MPMDIDGFAVLGAIARKPDAFRAVHVDVDKAAKALVGKQIKDKALTIEGLRAIAQAIEFEAFELILDGMSEAEVKSLLAKVDKLNTEGKAAPVPDQRKLIADLARGTVAPAAKASPAQAPKPAKAPPKPKLERSGNSKAARARKKV